jgi:hypothetical protein
MNHRLEFRPDLNDCLLEDRPLMAPVVPSLPWLMITGTNSFVSGGSSGSGVPNLSPLPGPPVMMGGLGSLASSGVSGSNPAANIGGLLFSYYGMGYGAQPTGPNVSAAAASAASGSTNGGARAGASPGYGATISSGYGTSLNAQNNFGMGPSTAAIGQTTSGGGDVVANQNTATAETQSTPEPTQGNSNAGSLMLGVDPRRDNMLKGVTTAPPMSGVTGR